MIVPGSLVRLSRKPKRAVFFVTRDPGHGMKGDELHFNATATMLVISTVPSVSRMLGPEALVLVEGVYGYVALRVLTEVET